MKKVSGKTSIKNVKLAKVFLILIASVSLLTGSLFIFFSCTAGVDVEEINKILTSFSIQWPQEFDYNWYTSAKIPVTIKALDQNGQPFNWEGLVDLYTTNPKVFVFPKIASLANGTLTTNLQFFLYAFGEEIAQEDTSLQLRYQDIMTTAGSTIHVDKLVKPAASFAADKTRGNTPLEVQFSDSSTGHILNWDWDFNNDGVIDSTEQNPVYNFNAPGNYTVTLKVTGPSGELDADYEMKSRYILAGNNVPYADFTATNVSGDPPLEVEFTDLSQGDIDTWEWDFGDGSAHSDVPNPSHEYTEAGYYPVTLTVSGPNGTDSITMNYYIMVYGFFSALGDPGFSAGGASYITLCVDNGDLYVAYTDSAYSGKEVSGKSPSGRATVKVYNGTYWETVGVEGFSEGDASYTSFYVDDGTPYIAYRDGAHSNKVTVMKFNGTLWEVIGSEGFSEGEALYISLYVDEGTPYVAYRDGGNEDEATVMKYNGTSWEAVGTEGFSAGQADYVSLILDSSGTPYVAYQDGGNSGNATVMKFSGTSWENVGTAGFSAGQAEYVSLALDSSNTPYVAYRDGGNENKATVMKFNGSDWEPVGISGFSTGEASYTALFMYSDTPYVTYMDGAYEDRSTIMKYNGTTWEVVGSEGFSGGVAAYTSVVVYNGTPYIAYSDGIKSSRATVLMYNESGWQVVGKEGISAGEAQELSLYVYNNTPYVAYHDRANDWSATVLKFNGLNWETVGIEGFTGDRIHFPSIYVYKGTPYLAYQDWSNNRRAKVVKFNGTSWEAVGGPGFSELEAQYTSLYVDNGSPEGTLYVAFSDYATNYWKATVMEYTGNTTTDSDGQPNDGWEYVGSPGFSAGGAAYLSLYVYSGTPYIAYMDGAHLYKATVMMYTGVGDTGWEVVGSEGFSEDEAKYISLYVHDGIPYVGYQDYGLFNWASVMKYDGSWQYVGSQGFTPTTAEYLSLHMYNGTPYIAYKHIDVPTQLHKASVMKFNGTSWEDAGTSRFSSGTADYFSLFVYNGTPYVAYRDWANDKKVTVMRLW